MISYLFDIVTVNFTIHNFLMIVFSSLFLFIILSSSINCVLLSVRFVNTLIDGQWNGRIYSHPNTPYSTPINANSPNLDDKSSSSSPIVGTLADLKKHRAQTRLTTAGSDNVLATANGSIVTTAAAAAGTASPNQHHHSSSTAELTLGGKHNSGDSASNHSSIPIELSLISASSTEYTKLGGGGGGGIGTAATAEQLEINGAPTKFCGVTGDVVSDSTRSKRCCIVMQWQQYSGGGDIMLNRRSVVNYQYK